MFNSTNKVDVQFEIPRHERVPQFVSASHNRSLVSADDLFACMTKASSAHPLKRCREEANLRVIWMVETEHAQ
jgi:hypothetical protein